ncbi:MAG: glycoside hydrolase family 38 C-terminal domain-containing protein [Tepidisphaeraceae bacterium]
MKSKARTVIGRAALWTIASLTPAAFAAPATQPAIDLSTQKTLYAVGYAHLDTQWRWTYPLVIKEYIHNTLKDNFALIEKYPHYVFNFSGSRRYQMMKEYYPEDYAKLKQYIAAGRWFVCGSCVDENDALVPSGESQLRHVLYGNQFSRREFGMESQESMLPDCFGFPASLPSILAHSGLRGFSTQKLSWGSAIGIPFKVGVWNGVDGQGVIAGLDPGAYTGTVRENLATSDNWLRRITSNGDRSGVYTDYHYFGTGDKGGAPGESSVEWIEKSATTDGPLKVITGTAEQMFVDITNDQRAKLPVYQGELLLTEHSAGSPTSQAYMKRWNRKSELLADGAERASVAAMWLGGLPYPTDRLYNAWDLVLGSQMHDMLPGTSVPKAYEYCWNDYVIALNQFAEVETSAVAAIASQLDTQVGQGVPLVVYNPLAIEREDVVEANVTLPAGTDSVNVVGPDGNSVRAQVLSSDGTSTRIAFLAKAPSVGFAVYHVQPGGAATQETLKITERTVENDNLRVTLNDAGDIASVFDKKSNKEMLREPARLAFVYHRPRDYPAWNMDWEDQNQPPRGYVDGPATFRVVENGPARVALEVTRHAQGSTFVQRIQLAANATRVDIANTIDWATQERALKATFPLVASNEHATYDAALGTVSRGNNDPKKYEVPQQQWFDLTDSSGNFGMSVLNDSKFASDKPSDNEVRLTLLYTPGVRGVYQDQSTQDIGRHQITYSLAPHAGDWKQGGTTWNARRLNQPLRAFNTSAHAGALGKSFSLVSVSSPQIEVQAIKKAEDSNDIIVRVKETSGAPASGITIAAGAGIVSATEVDGQERRIGDAAVTGDKIVTDVGAYRLKTFALKLAPAQAPVAASKSQPVELSFDTDAVSTNANRADGKFDDAGRSYPAEQFPTALSLDGVDFKFGATTDGANNAVTAKGQTISIPAGTERVYVIAAAANGDRDATFKVGDTTFNQRVQDWSSYIGQWDNRLWSEVIPENAFNISAHMTGLVRGFIKRDAIAWFCSHRHSATEGDEAYSYSYLFKYGFDVPAGATSFTLPSDEHIRVFAVSAVTGAHARVAPAAPLYDTLDEHKSNGVPTIEAGAGTFNDVATVTIKPPLYWQQGLLRYTLDGSEPTSDSPAYDGGVLVTRSGTIKARQFAADGSAGAVAEASVKIDDKVAPKLTGVAAVDASPLVTLEFSEPIDASAAANVANYKVAGGDVKSATLSSDGKRVVLQLAAPLAVESTTVTVSNLHDRSENANPVDGATAQVAVSRPIFKLAAVTTSDQTIEKPVEGLNVEPGKPWSMNLFMRTDRQLDSQTVIAGFGRDVDGKEGAGRYFARFDSGLHFWVANRDVPTDGVSVDVRKWQMLTATYDGHTLRLYKNGAEVAKRDVELEADEAVVRIAPPDPWQQRRRFRGDIAEFTIWNAALSPAAIRQMASEGLPKLVEQEK